MSFEIVLRREAEVDLDKIFIWYEEQKVGLGLDFINEFEAVIYRILRNPSYASYIKADARSASLKRFPYDVIYRINELNRQVRIIAVIHQRRSPEWFKSRL